MRKRRKKNNNNNKKQKSVNKNLKQKKWKFFYEDEEDEWHFFIKAKDHVEAFNKAYDTHGPQVESMNYYAMTPQLEDSIGKKKKKNK